MLNAKSYILLQVDESYGELTLGSSCDGAARNPRIRFTTLPSADAATGAARVANVSTQQLAVVPGTQDDAVVLSHAMQPCELAAYGTVFLRTESATGSSTDYFVFDRRSTTLTNALERPTNLSATPERQCPSVPKTFLSEEFCVANQVSCVPLEYERDTTWIRLNETTLRQFYTRAGLPVHYVIGLSVDDEPSPCEGGVARWVRRSDTDVEACADAGATLSASTHHALSAAVRAASGGDIRDAVVDGACDDDDSDAAVGALINVTSASDGVSSCWEHVHGDEYNVYDFSVWSQIHPGNDDEYDDFRRNPIADFAERANFSVALEFPSWHPINRWNDYTESFGEALGRLGDIVDFAALPARTQTAAAAAWLGAIDSSSRDMGDGFEACGSPGEVHDEPALGARFTRYVATANDPYVQSEVADHPYSNTHSKQMVWFGVALGAPDQLRQRVAWALAQVLVVGDHLTGRENEVWHTFSDIFVRHAFGNYRDVLREVSYSPLMADYLTFLQNKGLSYQREVLGAEAFPDENFAREIMQLFTIGLFKLGADGTRERDVSGTPVATYDNDDVMSFARAWTGFDRQDPRTNIESYGPKAWGANNWIDPMKIEAVWRDPFPKRDLLGGYIGDGFPLCSDAPSRAFLRKGAKWRYLGFNSPLPDLQTDNGYDGYDHDTADVTRLDLHPFNSSLYAALCKPGAAAPLGAAAASAPCAWQSTVILGADLPCDGIECDVDTARVVRLSVVNSTNTTVWFEYVRAPCVEMTYFPDARIIRGRWASGDELCADPREAVAVATCCDAASSSAGEPLCAYKGERVRLATAEARCAAAGATTCNYAWVSSTTTDCGSQNTYWTSAPCYLRAQVDASGKVSVVHNTSAGRATGGPPLRVQPNSGNAFRVSWGDDQFPTAAAGCAPADVCVAYGESCVCNVTVAETAVFTESDDVPTRDEIVSTLKIGGSPGTRGSGAFTSVPFHGGDVIVHSRVADDDEGGPAPTPAPTIDDWHGRVFNVTLTPTDDGYVNTWPSVSMKNYGTSVQLRVRQTNRAVYLSYLRFKVSASAASSDHLAQLETHNYTFSLRAATLRLQTYSLSAPIVDTSVYLVNTSFHEGNLSYDIAPPPASYSSDPPTALRLAYRENLGANFTDGTGWEPFELDVDSLGGVGASVARGDWFAFQLRSSDVSTSASYSSKEGDAAPELVLSLEALRETVSPTLSPAPTHTPTPSPTSAPSASLAPTTAASRVVLDADTIFEVVGSDREPAYFRNLASTVRIGTGGGNASVSFEFRNPPHFVSFIEVEMTARDAAHETEAVLDHLMEHPNTAPFVAHRFIQRFTSSNPSPRYVKVVATAFSSGNYSAPNGSGVVFGAGRRGDLAATVAAVLLDREARATVLDHDRAHGRMREPLLKVLHFMRSMEFESRNGREVELNQMQDVIGQSSYESPTVFNVRACFSRACF